MDDETLDPEAIASEPAGDTPPPDPAATPPPATPAFELAIDERTRYTDPDAAKRGFTELKQNRDQFRTQAERLEEENRRLKMALGGEPKKPAKWDLTPESKAANEKWRDYVIDEHGFLTKDHLDDPEVQRKLEAIVEKREQDQLVARGTAHVDKLLKQHEITLSKAERQGLLDYFGAVIGHEDSVELAQRFLSGDMVVLDELVEKQFAAHIESRRKAADEKTATEQAQRDQRGRFAKLEAVKDKMRKAVPAGPPKGGAAAVADTRSQVPKTPEERRKKVYEMLEQAG